MFDFLSKEKPTIYALQILNESEKTFLETKSWILPVGSVLNYQCSLIPADFNVYSNLPTFNQCEFNYLQFPDFPFKLGTHSGFKWVLQVLFNLKPQWIHSKF